jgi:hypothetical protein
MKKTSKRPIPPRNTVSFRLTPLPRVFGVAFRWAGAWAVAGLVLGVLLMLGKALPFAESGSRPDSVSGYFFWIPAVGAGAAAAGLGIGLLFAFLMALTTDWRDSLEGDGLVERLGPDVLCGTIAGLIPGLMIGGIGGALFFAILGGCSAAGMNWWAARAS